MLATIHRHANLTGKINLLFEPTCHKICVVWGVQCIIQNGWIICFNVTGTSPHNIKLSTLRQIYLKFVLWTPNAGLLLLPKLLRFNDIGGVDVVRKAFLYQKQQTEYITWWLICPSLSFVSIKCSGWQRSFKRSPLHVSVSNTSAKRLLNVNSCSQWNPRAWQQQMQFATV